MSLNRRIMGGLVGGLLGGMVLALVMDGEAVLQDAAALLGAASPAAAWLVPLLYGGVLGILFGLLAGMASSSLLPGLVSGLLYGGAWWLLGPLTLLPLAQGQMPRWDVAAMSQALSSLVGHLVYGLVLGITYAHFVPFPAGAADERWAQAQRASQRRHLAGFLLSLLLVLTVVALLWPMRDVLSGLPLELPRGGSP